MYKKFHNLKVTKVFYHLLQILLLTYVRLFNSVKFYFPDRMLNSCREQCIVGAQMCDFGADELHTVFTEYFIVLGACNIALTLIYPHGSYTITWSPFLSYHSSYNFLGLRKKKKFVYQVTKGWV